MAKNKDLKLVVTIAGRMDKTLTAAINSSNGALDSLTRTMSRVGTAGLAAMGALATAGVADMVKCTEKAEEFESSMAYVAKYVDGLADSAGKVTDALAMKNGKVVNGKTYAENYAEMQKVILDLSTQIPYTAEELTQLAAAAGQSGKSIEELFQRSENGDITGFLRDVAMVGTAFDIDADLAGQYGAKWEVALNKTHDGVMELFDQINYLGANSATTAAEIANVVNKSASLGQVAGVDASVTAALGDAMLAMGVNSDRAATSVKRMLTNVSQGADATSAIKGAFQSLGMTAEQVAKDMQIDSTGTLLKIFEAIQALPKDRQMGTLKNLFGQWSIEGGAKIVNNLSAFTDALAMVNDPSLYKNSMLREFVLQSETSEALAQRMQSAVDAFQIDFGTALLPAKKQFSLAIIDTINTLRNMPELGQIAEQLGTLFGQLATGAADALQRATPYIKEFLDYLINNGPQVISMLGKLAGAFVAMKFSPAIVGGAQGIGNLIFGQKKVDGKGRTGGLLKGIGNLFSKGQIAGAMLGNIASEVGQNGIGTSITALFNTARNTVGAKVANSGIAGIAGNIGSSLGNLGSSITGGLGLAGNMLKNSALGQNIGSFLMAHTQGLRTGLAGLGATASIYGSMAQQSIGGVIGNIGNAFGNVKNAAALKFAGFANSGLGTVLGNIGGSIGNVLGAGGGVLSSIWGPVASGFGSLLAGAAPVVAAISGIIAVVSILGDNLDGIRDIVGNAFGDKGLAIFDAFTDKLGHIGAFIQGLFDGGVADALSGVRDMIQSTFGDGAAQAFDGLTGILQSVMNVVGQVVDFAITYVKPIILEIFSFIKDTVVPTLLNVFSTAAPFISSILQNVGTAVMTVFSYIAQGIQAAMPVIEGIITAILNIGSVVVPALLAGVSAFTAGLAPIIEGVKEIFGGIIDFVTGVFTGNWEQAWGAVKDIFGGIFDTLEALIKTPINAVISIINQAIKGINKLGIKIPDWVPIIGGKGFYINIPEIPMLAKGGFTSGPSIAGEAGPEAVISFDRAVRAQNLQTWAQAGKMLGVGNQVELKQFDPNRGGGGGGSFTFAPQITINGNADRDVIEEALREAEARFKDWYEQMQWREQRTRY